MSEPLDLDALRAARPAAKTRQVVLGGKTFDVPGSLSVELALAAEESNLRRLLEGLFGEQLPEVLAIRPPLEVDDLRLLVNGLAGGPGNSRGSAG